MATRFLQSFIIQDANPVVTSAAFNGLMLTPCGFPDLILSPSLNLTQGRSWLIVRDNGQKKM